MVIKVSFTIHANQSNVSHCEGQFFALKLCGNKNLDRVDFGQDEDNMYFEHSYLFCQKRVVRLVDRSLGIIVPYILSEYKLFGIFD
ncbi:hypothetical protein CN958_00110 [Bacillus cereus]|uniref:Uncharacterized protein n=1 Tax=Bacillus cereus TaxID=1396 RepID=A0A2B9EEI6_BACCE|nr:hypothetical protein CN958_00110 [Bacillus cereus]